MKVAKIRLETIDDAQAFLRATDKCECPVTVTKEKYKISVDGRSAIGIMQMVGTDILIVEVEDEEETDTTAMDEILERLKVQ